MFNLEWYIKLFENFNMEKVYSLFEFCEAYYDKKPRIIYYIFKPVQLSKQLWSRLYLMMVISETRVVCSDIICLSLLSTRNSNWWIKTVLKFSEDNIVSFLRFWLFLKQTLFQTFRKYNDEIFATGRLSNNDQLLLSPCSLIKWPQTH